jgi:hypothetical protein
MTDGSNDQDSAERDSDPPPGDRAPGGALALSVYAVDALLRRWYRIEDFTDDPDCLLRIAPKRERSTWLPRVSAPSADEPATVRRTVRAC